MPLGKKTEESLQSLCHQYDEVQKLILVHQDQHRRVYEKQHQLQEQLAVLGTRIKALLSDAAKTNKWRGRRQAYCGETVTVVVTPRSDREVNVAALLEAHPDLRNRPGLVQPETIKKSDLASLVEDGVLAQEVVDRYSTATPGTPSVTFQLNKE